MQKAIKQCSKCRRSLPFIQFHINSKNKDGLTEQCKDCRREYAVEYAARLKQKRLNNMGYSGCVYCNSTSNLRFINTGQQTEPACSSCRTIRNRLLRMRNDPEWVHWLLGSSLSEFTNLQLDDPQFSMKVNKIVGILTGAIYD